MRCRCARAPMKLQAVSRQWKRAFLKMPSRVGAGGVRVLLEDACAVRELIFVKACASSLRGDLCSRRAMARKQQPSARQRPSKVFSTPLRACRALQALSSYACSRLRRVRCSGGTMRQPRRPEAIRQHACKGGTTGAQFLRMQHQREETRHQARATTRLGSV